MSRRGEYRRWSEAERSYIRENMARLTTRQMCEHLGRTWQATDGMKRYLSKRDEYRQHSTPCSWCCKPIQRRIRRGHTRIYCNHKCSNDFHNTARKRRRPDAWSDAEKQFLRDHYGPLSAAQLAKALGRTVKGVIGQLFKLRIKHPRAWSAAEDEFLRTHVESWAWCAGQLGRTHAATKVRVRRLGLQRIHPTRLANHRRAMLAKYGVETPGALIRRRIAQARKAATVIQSQRLGEALEAACAS